MPRLPRFSCLISAVCLGTLAAAADQPELQWETSGFTAPESVIFDAQRREFYVSNLGSHGPGATPGDGYISRMAADGRLLETRWVTGLDNPKGLALAHGYLYVGDDRDLVVVAVDTGTIHERHEPADGPGQFNDCTADADGNVYVCSGRLNTVFRLHRGRFEPWVKLDPARTGGINGLRAEKDRLLLGGWSVRDPDGREVLGHLSTVDLRTKEVGRIGDRPICHIDGIEADGAGGYTVTDWLSGAVLRVSPAGVPSPLLQLSRGTADHAYVEEQQLLLIPLMLDNTVRAYRWSARSATQPDA